MKYYILDKDGNYINNYKTTLELAEIFETSANSFTRCANNISKLLKGEKPSNGVLAVKGFVCVKKEDYIDNIESIRWILTKDDILVINRNGDVVATHKSANSAMKSLGNGASKDAKRVLNIVNQETYGHRLATREHYVNMIKEDIHYYSREFDNSPGLEKIPVDMYNFKTGEFIRDFDSLTDTANYMGCSKECIRKAIKNNNPILGTDFCFKRADIKENF